MIGCFECGISEIVLLLAFFFTTALVCASIVIVNISIVDMYNSLSTSAFASIERAASDSASHIDIDISGTSHVGDMLATSVAHALDTPRIPLFDEIDSYVVVNNSDLDGGMSLIVAANDHGGGPAAVMYHIEDYDATYIDDIETTYFWRTGGLGPEMASMIDAWSSRIFQVYCITIDGFAVLYPYWDLSVVYVDLLAFPLLDPANSENNPNRATIWSPPYIDTITLEWIVTFMHPLYSEVGDVYVGTCGADMYITDILAYAESVSATLQWNAYVVIASSDGTLLAVPEKGSADWGIPVGSTYAAVCASADYNPASWNIFSEAMYVDVGSALTATGGGGSGRADVELLDGSRIVAWSTMPSSGWIVIAVIDGDTALASQKRARMVTIVIASIMGAVLAAAVISISIYVVVRRQYARLSSKVHNLNVELEAAQKTIAVLSGDDGVVITGGIPKIIATLYDVSERLDTLEGNEEQAKILKDAAHMIVKRSPNEIRASKALNADQLQFITDCGMKVTYSDSDTLSTHSSFRYIEYDSAPPSRLMTTAMIRIIVANIESWELSVFSIQPTNEAITTIAMSILAAERLEYEPLDRVKLEKFFKTLDDDYCGTSIDANDSAHRTILEAWTDNIDNSTWSTWPRNENPYHNHLHAADVLQAFYCMLKMAFRDSPDFASVVTHDDILACVIAAAGHDYRHPGVNNTYMRETLSPENLIFTSESTLERLHIAETARVLYMNREDTAPFVGMSKPQIASIQNTVSKLILATDMARHVDIIDAFGGWVKMRGTHRSFYDRAKLLVLQMLIKAADLANSFREWDVCHEWANRIYNEFTRQGKLEKQLGIQVSKFMDGSTPIDKMQETFIPLLVVPMLNSLEQVFPSFSKYVANATSNLARWRSISSTTSSH